MLENKNRIREIRDSYGMTQQQLGMRIDCTQENISAYETSRTSPSISKLIEICDLFGLSMDYVMMRTNCPYLSANSETKAFTETNRLVTYFNLLPVIQREKALSYIQGLLTTIDM